MPQAFTTTTIYLAIAAVVLMLSIPIRRMMANVKEANVRAA
jgi:hypothetical protein